MAIGYTDYIDISSTAPAATASTYNSRASTAQASSLAFSDLFQNILNNTSLTCQGCGASNSVGSFQVTLNELGFAPGTGYASAGAPVGIAPSMPSLYGSSFQTGFYSDDPSRMNIEWPRGQDVSDWDETVHISNVRVANGKISWTETGDRNSWPIGGEGNCNANAWIIQEQADGSYKASTWEYVRKGQTTKLTENIEEGGVISNPPRSGDRVGIMIAGITRNPRMRNIQARSNIAWITWP